MKKTNHKGTAEKKQPVGKGSGINKPVKFEAVKAKEVKSKNSIPNQKQKM